jgi:6-pyruvoyltetrahydropterin/6-carboxytetrahydropterin synthase
LDTNFDHGFILHAKDVSYVKMLQGISVSRGGGKPEPQKLFLLPTNPTAENIAAYLGEVVCPRLFFDHNVKVTRIRLHETENCYADWVA